MMWSDLALALPEYNLPPLTRPYRDLHMTSSRSPLIIRGGAYVLLRSLKFIRHSILRARTGSRNLRYRVRESAWGNALWRAAAFWRSPLEAWRRSRMADRFDTPGVATMDRVAGYKAFP